MFDPKPHEISQVIGSPLLNVEAHWPILKAELEKKGIKYDSGFIAALATVGVEVPEFKPIHEYGNKAYFMKNYDISGSKPHLAKTLGNTCVGDGYTYRGRGFIQLTGKSNYRSHSKIAEIDLVENPDAALDPHVASRIFAHYFRTRGCDFWAQKALTAKVDHCQFCKGQGLLLIKGGKKRRPNADEEVCQECCWKTVRRKVNGGLNHYTEFKKYVDGFKALISE